MQETRKMEVRLKNGLLAVLVASALVLTASSSTLAAGSKGGIGGDQFRRPRTELDQGGNVGGGADRPTAQGGKLGVGTGEGD